MKEYVLKEDFTFFPEFKGEDNGSMNSPIPITIHKGTVVNGSFTEDYDSQKRLSEHSVQFTYKGNPVIITLGKLQATSNASNTMAYVEKPRSTKPSVFTTKNIAIGVVGLAVVYFGLKHFKLIK